jgi:PAS domain S-box-containing protein
MTSHRAADRHDDRHGPRIVPDLYRRLVESIADYVIFAFDARGHVANWNPGAQRFKGYTADEIIGRHFSVFYPEEAVVSGFSQHELEVVTPVVLTTSNDERDKVEVYNLNVAGSLVKPVTFGNFCEVMVALNKYWGLVELL